MKNLPWIIAALGIAAAAYVVMNTPGPEYATGSDGVEGAARRTSQWGSKNRLGGAGASAVGKIKEGVGNLTGNASLANEGTGDQVAGGVKKVAGTVAQAAGQTLHDMNK